MSLVKTQAAIVTRECQNSSARFKDGCKRQTFYGLSGIGDLTLTVIHQSLEIQN